MATDTAIDSLDVSRSVAKGNTVEYQVLVTAFFFSSSHR